MFRNISHTDVCLIIFVISLLPYHSQALTSADVVERAVTKATAARNEVSRRKAKIERLEKKLVDSKRRLSKAEQQLRLEQMETSDEQSRTSAVDSKKKLSKAGRRLRRKQIETSDAESIIRAPEKEIRLTKRKIDKLAQELDDEKTSLINSQDKAAHYVGLEKQVKSRRHLELTRYNLERTKKQFKQYVEKVRKLEIEERETQAEVIARMKLAGRARGQWKRRFTVMKVRNAKGKADYLLQQLKTFREKTVKARQDINILTSELKEATADYSQYGNE